MCRVVLAIFASLVWFTTGAMAKEVSVSGSTSVSRIMEVLADEFNRSSDSTYIAVQGIGSTAGITMVKKGVSEIGMSSRYLTEAENNENLTLLTIAYDGIALVTNHSNPVTNISREQLYDIYKGKIKNWKAIGGEDRQIAVVTREQSSGSRSSFESLLGLTKVINKRQVSDINPTNLVVNSNSMVKTIVNHNPQAIGFVSDGSVDNSVKELQFEGVSATQKTIATQKYLLSRPFIIMYRTENLSADGKAFIDFIRSEQAQKLILQYGYVPNN